MRTHDVHVHCDIIVADIADVTNGSWGKHTMEQPQNSRVRRCPRSVLNSSSSSNSSSNSSINNPADPLRVLAVLELYDLDNIQI